MTDSTVTADREQLFAKLADPATTGKFFERVSDSVSWTVEGTHPLAGTYTSKQAFFDSTFAILGPLMRDGLDLEVQNLHVAGPRLLDAFLAAYPDISFNLKQGPAHHLVNQMRSGALDVVIVAPLPDDTDGLESVVLRDEKLYLTISAPAAHRQVGAVWQTVHRLPPAARRFVSFLAESGAKVLREAP